MKLKININKPLFLPGQIVICSDIKTIGHIVTSVACVKFDYGKWNYFLVGVDRAFDENELESYSDDIFRYLQVDTVCPK